MDRRRRIRNAGAVCPALQILVFLALIGCQTPSANRTAALSGTVTYEETRLTLPGSARLVLSLVEIPEGSGTFVPIAQDSFPVRQQVPIPFKLPYDAARIRSDRQYRLISQINVHGIMWYSNIASPAPVFGPNQPNAGLDLVLDREAALR